MKKTIWLPLSDTYRQGIIIDALVSDIKEQIREHNLKIDLIFVSGDVSFN